MGNISNLIFLDDPAQVSFLKESCKIDSTVKVVPLTADALWTLENSTIPYEPVCSFTDTFELSLQYEQAYKPLFLLLQEIEKYIGEQWSEFKFEGPGFLSGQVYYVGYSLSAIVKRFLLMKRVIEVCSPDKVTGFLGNIDTWFIGDGYICDPWVSLIQAFTTDKGIPHILLPCPTGQRKSLFDLRHSWYRKVRHLFHRDGFNMLSEKMNHSIDARVNGALRLLFIGGVSYDWKPVLSDLRKLKRGAYYTLQLSALDQRPWTNHYHSYLKLNNSVVRQPLNVEAPGVNKEEVQILKQLLYHWLKSRNKEPEITLFGYNIFPFLLPQISSMVLLGPSLARHADRIAMRSLKIAKPEAVCFSAMPNLSDKRLAYICKNNGVPVLSYQHGFGYSVQIAVKDEETDPMHADYFFTYGSKIQPRSDTPFPAKAEYIAIGSARIEQMIKKRRNPLIKRGLKFKLLWIAESSTRNTLVSSLTEDTKRYLMQKTCLDMLGKSKKFNIVYRPLSTCAEYDGITPWLMRAKLKDVKVNIVDPLERLIKSSNLVIADISSPTTWAEVLALRIPMIFYCDPRQTPLTSEIMLDLDRACRWCKTPEELLLSIKELVDDPAKIINEKGKIDPSEFIYNYILPEGNCSLRVISFIEKMRNPKYSG
jgi:hypothetical protein